MLDAIMSGSSKLTSSCQLGPELARLNLTHDALGALDHAPVGSGRVDQFLHVIRK